MDFKSEVKMLKIFFACSLMLVFLGCSSSAKRSETDKFSTGSTQLEIFGDASDPGKKPTLRPAKVRVRHVDDQIKDGIFIPAHLEYEISEPARWENSK